MCGNATKALLVYLTREKVKSVAAEEDPEYNYDDFDSNRIAHFLSIRSTHRNMTEE